MYIHIHGMNHDCRKKGRWLKLRPTDCHTKSSLPPPEALHRRSVPSLLRSPEKEDLRLSLHAKNGLDDHSRTNSSMVGTFFWKEGPLFEKELISTKVTQKKSRLIPASVMNNLSSQLKVGVVEIPLLTGPKQNWTESVMRMATSQNGWLTSLFTT